MRIALAGLATSHPYTDARSLREHAELVVWEPDPQRLARFRTEQPAARVASGLAALLDDDLDGVVLTVPTPQVAQVLDQILERDLPCFVNKPAAGTAGQLAALDDVVRRAPHRVLTSSVLRFAPGLAGLSVPRPEVLAARVTVRHDVGLWATGYNPWQDDPATGGGTLVTMGIHGVELLVTLLGPEVELVGAVASTRHHHRLRSEDTAVLTLRWVDGVLGTVEVIGVSRGESYEVVLQTLAGEREVRLDSAADHPEVAFGYRNTVDAFLRMVRGQASPVPWSQTAAVLRILATARAMTTA